MNEIKKEDILSAIQEIDREGIRSGRHSSTYDLIHEGKHYPPKLVISIANRFATGGELDSSIFSGGVDTPAFQLLKKEGFEIIPKADVTEESINVKEDFVNWMIEHDGKKSNYFSKQFGSKKERLVQELDLYELEYKKNFESELFIIKSKNSKIEINSIKKNIYDKTAEFSKFSENRSRDRPRAILGKDNYLKFLQEKLGQKNTINYWIFQGNPKFYDVVGSLQNELLTTWKVATHKDKIKKGDKVILWLTGENSGCYALAKVTSDVGRISASQEEIKYYKTGYDENEDRVAIEIDLHKHVMTKLKNDDLGKNFEYSSRTFDRDKKDIFDLFGMLIQYNRKDKVYSIDEEIEDPSVSRMIEAFSIHQALKEGNKLSPSIYLEKRKVTGTHLISGILYAIQNRFLISFTHTKFWDMEISQRSVKPLAIKESEHRWYLIAQDEKDGIVKNFGFDRITDLKISDTTFKAISFDVDKKYQHAFGIETYEPVQKIILSFTWQQGNYIKSFPLHSSQKVLKDTDEELVIELDQS
ncbi:WYL domain-containing protein [Flavobacterium crassostreae]|uniref:EVE domain-containing protein n=1 Tax=Flavobacterium crassostreae TaxID=1763534 RepID=A0A1B9DWF5_9FLAO|nr:WYL domain-containing protein [Flavobacterium crassostreae]OCB74002.1 hypothetical protein LPBF_11095 [Flavobacterium crassostreae]